MSTGLVSHYKAVRGRLWNPLNAVPDIPISLKRKIDDAPIIKKKLYRPDPPEPEPEPEIPTPIHDWTDRQIAMQPTIISIAEAVCAVFNVPVWQVMSPCRIATFMLPRHIICALCRRLTTRSYPEIGRRLGGRDHSTVLNGVRNKAHLIAAVSPQMGDSLDPMEWATAIHKLVTVTNGGGEPCA